MSPPKVWLGCLMTALLAIGVLVFGQPVSVDTEAAAAALQYLADLNTGRSWPKGAVQEMVRLPGHQALIAHHARLDPTFTEDAFVEALLALQEGRSLIPKSVRLARIQAAWRQAVRELPVLQKWIEGFSAPEIVVNALKQARRALPAEATIEATVYLVLDGRSPGYAEGRTVVLDVLQIPNAAWAIKVLAHEFHHLGAASLLPDVPCSHPALAQALGFLIDMIHEGSALYFVDHLPCAVRPEDFAGVEALLKDILRGPLSTKALAARKATLLTGNRRDALSRRISDDRHFGQDEGFSVGGGPLGIPLGTPHGLPKACTRREPPLLGGAHRSACTVGSPRDLSGMAFPGRLSTS